MFRRPCQIAVAVLVVSAATLLLAQEPAEGRKIALLIGVQKYGDDTKLRNLDYTENDAHDLGAVLDKLGYKVTILTRSEATKQDKDFLRPTARNIRAHLDALVKNRKPADTVLIAFSGHGAHLKTTGKLYFCPTDTDLGDEKSLIAIDDVSAAFQTCAAGSKVLLMDACRNDPADGRDAETPPELKSVTRPLLPDLPGGTVALFSCSKGQIAHESRTFKRGFLFHTVIEGLSGKAANPKTGEVTWPRLTTYVTEELPEAVHAEKGPKVTQTPEIRGEARQFVLAKYAVGDVKPGAKELDLGGGVKLALVPIPAGKFQMGSPDSDNEKPPHEVTISDAFHMGKFTVTVRQFRQFVTDARYQTEAEKANVSSTWKKNDYSTGDDHPVVWVSHNDAVKFCEWLSKKTGQKVTLPTEAQWEYACRAGATTRYHFGDDESNLGDFAWFGKNSGIKAHPVGEKKANAWGLHDMHGNVWQWCLDAKREYRNMSETDPSGGSAGAQRVYRGGSFLDGPRFARAADRNVSVASNRYVFLGFRVVLVR